MKCRFCDTEIDFITMRSGKKMPVEGEYIPYDELKEGEVIITDSGSLYKRRSDNSFPSVKGRISHFSTCVPEAQR